jgi:metal dependent phosphohydrolase
MTEQLIEVLIEKFRDQKDRGGHPYIEHIFRVAEEAEALQVGSYITGLIHDALEDTDLTADDLFLLGVRNADINRVSVLTRKSDDVYEHYINRIKKYAKQYNDKIILAVKIADLNDNLNASRLKGLNNQDLLRLQRYMNARKKLSATLDNLNRNSK